MRRIIFTLISILICVNVFGSVVLKNSLNIQKQFSYNELDYIINSTIDLKGKTIYLPANSSLTFNSGGIVNGKLYGNNIRISADPNRRIFKNIQFFGIFHSEEASPKWFGALGDGRHDDTGAIISAYRISNNLFFPSGKYIISSPINVRSNSIISGVDSTSVIMTIKDDFTMNNVHWTSDEIDSNIVVKNIRIDAKLSKATSEYSAGMYFCGVKNINIKRVWFENIGGDGIYIGKGKDNKNNNNVNISNCSFVNYGRNSSTPRQGVALINGYDITIQKCKFYNKIDKAYGIDFEPNKYNEGGTLLVKDCFFSSCGISAGGHPLATKKITIQNCRIENSHIKKSFGIAISNATGSIINSKISSDENGIIINGVNNFDVSYSEISSNELGVYMVKSSNIKLTNCNIKGQNGVIIDSSVKNVIEDNVISASRTGVKLSTTSSVNKIINNKIESGNNDGVIFENRMQIANTIKNNINKKRMISK